RESAAGGMPPAISNSMPHAGVTLSNALDPAQVKRSTAQIMRIKPDLDNIPPSQRPGVLPVQSREADAKDLELSEPSLLTRDNLSANFNAIGTIKGKKVKGAPLQVERPDGRIKRYFTVSDMKEVKKVGKR